MQDILRTIDLRSLTSKKVDIPFASRQVIPFLNIFAPTSHRWGFCFGTNVMWLRENEGKSEKCDSQESSGERLMLYGID